MDLDSVVEGLKKELANNPSKLQAEKDVIEKFGNLFRYDNIDNITAEQFQSFLDYKEKEIEYELHLIASDEISQALGIYRYIYSSTNL